MELYIGGRLNTFRIMERQISHKQTYETLNKKYITKTQKKIKKRKNNGTHKP